MTITLFEDKNCKGASKVVSGNIADLKGKAYDKPTSVRMTQEDDAILLFKNDDWKGSVHYLRGKQTVDNLGKKDEGGRFGFKNSVRSVRCTPFTLEMNISVVKGGRKLPGDWNSEAIAEKMVRTAIVRANNYFRDKQAMLEMDVARITFRNDSKRFILKRKASFPGSWKNRGEVDLIFVERFQDTDNNTLGRARFPCGGQTIVVATKTDDGGATFDEDDLAYILAHEIGHYLGLSHNTANDKTRNLMFPSKSGSLNSKHLKEDQIREMHQKLSKNISRKGDRN